MKASLCETEIDRLHTSNKKHVYKGRKKKQHMKRQVKENIHQHKERDKYNVCL